ncbi:MAG: DUF192 domain-containing protein [Candidatus Magasanikbacteria bacterium]|nr:DUF192 domain-containing protein [Candidatus Magasanikbacteria bacterium]
MGIKKKKGAFKKINLIFLGIFFVAFSVLSVWNLRTPSAVVVLQDKNLNVMVSNTKSTRYKGLSNRKDFGKFDGMMFLFDNFDRHGFVMRDMEFSIDIVWFNSGKVVDIAPNLQPENISNTELMVYYPRKDSNMVLELPANWAEQNNLKIGDILTVSDK